MINRALIRVKTVQLLYAHQTNPKNAKAAESELMDSLDRTYELYHWILQLVVELHEYAIKRIEIGLNKLRPTEEEAKPNKRFINNKWSRQIVKNKQLIAYNKEHGISWEDSGDLIKNLFDAICASDIYKDYMKADKTDYADDKMAWRHILKNVIGKNEELETRLEEMNLYWNDDAEIVFSFVEKTIKQAQPDDTEDAPLQPMYRNEDDKDFATDLYKYALEGLDRYTAMIVETARNWDAKRIAPMDYAIMQAALAELTHFPTIPVNVTLNEYIEISKFYSTEKSANFINGILDNIVNKLRKEGSLLKVGALVQE